MRAILSWMLPVCLGIGAAVFYLPAWGQDCKPFDAVDTALREQFQERTIILAVNAQGVAFMFYGNPDTETWTLVVLTGPCAQVVAEGTGYEEIPAFPGQGA
jgi:hypothetical protein